MADCIDKGMLYGQSGVTYAPAGIMNDSNINTLTAENDNYVDFVKAFGAVRRANGTPNTMAINAQTEEQLALTIDTNNKPVVKPEILNGLKTVVSNQLVYDSTDGSDALVFDSNAMVIGMQKDIVIRIFEDSDYCIKNNMVGFQIYSMLDSAVVRPTHVTKISGIKES